MEGTLVGGPGRSEIEFATFLKSACCNATMYRFRVEAMGVQLNACAGCDAVLGSPEDWDMALISGGEFPLANEILENLTFVDLETGPQSFRTITII